MIETLVRELVAQIRQTREYGAYVTAKEKALADQQTAALLKRFHRLQMTVQARRLAGSEGGPEEEELKKLAELRQFSPDAAVFLLAEYSLNRLLTNTYDTIARGVGVDFSDWGK